MIYIGIDPGVGGGISALSDTGMVLRCERMPDTYGGIYFTLAELAHSSSPPPRAVLEKVGPTPQMGRSSAFVFGQNYGALKMALAATGIPYDEVPSGRWQALLGCRSGGDKNITKRRAAELFPAQKVTHAVSDALLLAEYCRRFWLNRTTPDPQPDAPVKQHPLTKAKRAAKAQAAEF